MKPLSPPFAVVMPIATANWSSATNAMFSLSPGAGLAMSHWRKMSRKEAFVRAYRRLWLLGDGAKFAGWVNTIARRLAINFGLRHRRELNKRERWALEISQTSNRYIFRNGNRAVPFTRRKPCARRWPRCPTPIANAWCCFTSKARAARKPAAALGISEAALRVRLHRARAA